MKEVIKIKGGIKLNGTIKISGAKNATVALIPAVVLGTGITKLYGVPNISDVDALSDILKYLDVDVLTPEEDVMIINTKNMHNKPLIIDAVSKLRASYYFMGALLGKYKDVTISLPGGCNLGPRPIDLHLKGFEELGATIDIKDDVYHLHADRLIGKKIYLDVSSVGATINIMMAACLAEGTTIIENAAREPEVIDLANLLNKMGANISGVGTTSVTIVGCQYLTDCVHDIIPDRIEAGTFLIASAIMAEHVHIDNIIPYHVESLITKLVEMGANITVDYDSVDVYAPNKLTSIKVKTAPFPGFATDLQAPLSVALTQAKGNSIVTETIYPDRFNHAEQLNKMGANLIVNKPTCTIVGPTNLIANKVSATDLRCGGALVVAGLIAQGITTIDNIGHIDRGYDSIDEKLRLLGAQIWREFEE